MTPAVFDAPFRGRYRKADLVIEVIVIVAIIGLVLAGSPRTPPRADVKLTVERSAAGLPIPAGFLGLSMEYTSVERYAGSDPGAINPVFERLIANLAPGQRPVLRIGGDSTDRTWWPVPGLTAPAGIRFTLGTRWLQVTRAMTQALRARVIFGINLEAASATVARAEAGALLGGVGSSSIRALEPGNEPELYGKFAWYRAPDGTKVTGRPRSYDYPAFASDYAGVAAALPNVPLAGPAFGSFAWTDHLGEFLAGEPRVGLVTLHRYPLQHCFIRPGSPRYPTIANLLTPAALTGFATTFARFAAVAHARHLPLRIDELNTVSCGAVPAVSRSFASALWAVDALFEIAHAGIDGVNVHTFPGAGYQLFTFTHSGGGWRATVSPEYYGLLLFALAAPPGARLVQSFGAAPSTLKSWATVSPDGSLRVVLINEDFVRSHVVAVRVPGATRAASLVRMQAPGLRARTGVSLGGASFGPQTGTGVLRPTADSVSPAGGSYTVRVPAASAALITVAGTHN